MALYDFKGQDSNQLSFHRGDKVSDVPEFYLQWVCLSALYCTYMYMYMYVYLCYILLGAGTCICMYTCMYIHVHV